MVCARARRPRALSDLIIKASHLRDTDTTALSKLTLSRDDESSFVEEKFRRIVPANVSTNFANFPVSSSCFKIFSKFDRVNLLRHVWIHHRPLCIFFFDRTDRAFIAIYQLHIVYNIVVGSIKRAIVDRSIGGGLLSLYTSTHLTLMYRPLPLLESCY